MIGLLRGMRRTMNAQMEELRRRSQALIDDIDADFASGR